MFSAQEAEEVEGGSLDYESRMLEQFCIAEDRLLSTYVALNKLNEDVSLLAPVPNTKQVSSTLCLLGFYILTPSKTPNFDSWYYLSCCQDVILQQLTNLLRIVCIYGNFIVLSHWETSTPVS